MSRRSRTRISRPLIAALGLTIAVGGGVYLHNVNKSHAAHADRERMSLKAVEPDVLDVKPAVPSTSLSAQPPTPTAPSTSTVLMTQTPGVLVTQTPGTNAVTDAQGHGDAATRGRGGNAKATAPSAVSPTPRLPVAASPTPASVQLASASIPAAVGPHFLDDAKARIDAGDLLGAREILNAALLAGHISAADADTTRHSLSELNKTLIFSQKPSKNDPFVTRYQVQSGERLAKIADKNTVTWELLCRINGLADARKVRAGQYINIPKGPFNCLITKTAFRLDVYLGSPAEPGSLFVTSYMVGLGKDNSTPTGSWILMQGSKAHPATYYSPRGEGVIAATDPKNPLGGYWMGLAGVSGNAVEKNSYGIHGTIDPDSIGKQASMGCIRLGHDDIAMLYDLLVDGKSKVLVKD
jgi:LysM repeat protein